MRRHNERIYRAARAILRDESEAEDVMQQAYVNAYCHLRQFHSPLTAQLAPMTSTPDPERQTFGRELGVLIESAIDRLSDGAREVFVLRLVEGMSTEEVAATLDVSEAVIKTRSSRARATLRRDLCRQAGLAESNAFRFLRPRCDRVVAGVLAPIL
jgi:RNA polymerase sigma-70 factor (ECF subfamily)